MKQTVNGLRKLVFEKLLKRDYVEVAGSIIPVPDRRWCGPEFKDDAFYLKSAEVEANRLIRHFGCARESRIFDIGCGQGRLANGILRTIGDIRSYVGVDIDRPSVDWCKRHIERHHTTFRFRHLNLYNERYNPNGIKIDDAFRFEQADKSIDVAYLFSVFSHTTEADMRTYLKEISRVVVDGGNLFFTTFVEENVPGISINPEGYRLKCAGPLHVVRYEKAYLFAILREYGYSLVDFTYATEADGQSAIYLRNRQ